ncbi:hypothetical protein, partial [Kitasatospora sp. LaBMicrA B282]|uniref:hypothetical protein n=1 Tax=Kitasatospora sp. LaBMicrA B282 TaxID=3420949 RepID=UPI003D15352E
MEELIFLGREQLRPVGRRIGGPVLLTAVVCLAPGLRTGGPVGGLISSGSAAAVLGLLLWTGYRSSTVVGVRGVTVHWGFFGRGRTHAWHEIEWIGIHEPRPGLRYVRFRLRGETRLRFLPGLQDGGKFPDPELTGKAERITAWWELCTDAAGRGAAP